MSKEEIVSDKIAVSTAETPAGDWGYFLDGARPRWSSIIISGISHGASSAGVVGMMRSVSRAVMLSGPLDSNQAWLRGVPLTPIDPGGGASPQDSGMYRFLPVWTTMYTAP